MVASSFLLVGSFPSTVYFFDLSTMVRPSRYTIHATRLRYVSPAPLRGRFLYSPSSVWGALCNRCRLFRESFVRTCWIETRDVHDPGQKYVRVMTTARRAVVGLVRRQMVTPSVGARWWRAGRAAANSSARPETMNRTRPLLIWWIARRRHSRTDTQYNNNNSSPAHAHANPAYGRFFLT